MRTHAIVAAFAALAFAAPVLAPAAAFAQSAPSYANPGPQDEQIHGRIAAFDGGYNLTVRDERGFNDTIQLHQGTIINPTGLTLQPGMVVSIAGYNAGGFFAANEIDTPYQFYGGVPYYNNYPWYHYGPSVSLGFFFGSGAGWWHGDYYGRDAYGYRGSVRVYNNYHPNAFYHGGTYNGRAYVASPEHGGYRAPLGGPHVAPGSGGYRSGAGSYRGAAGGGGHAAPASRGGGGGGDHHH